ncbi:glucose-methanol-choline oxidoreductase [Colletotrichum orchidophilum]|uniref:Glucose-methanol-choline oxidoreductase n=1 Tax=Colletotrichum orchidophilum TaxID=1209926 RepID=A0A1G4BC84_9PEZI|nr:glucose-methanol-choline oxidoreductase [Colletotrichum orchidophilum]OHE99020.1 glucose-methanol-choline oxidoreductase [Colletotrichum orchidophilum]
MGKSLLGLALSSVTGLGQVLPLELNAPGQTSKTGIYHVPLSMTDCIRRGPGDLIWDIANAVNADRSRKYQLDIKLDTLLGFSLLKLDDLRLKAELDSFKIPVVVGFPRVGANMQDRHEATMIVRGIQGLWVIDASVSPKIPVIDIALPLYVVSEKASDVIIQEAKDSLA